MGRSEHLRNVGSKRRRRKQEIFLHPPTHPARSRKEHVHPDFFRVLALAGKTRIGRFRNCGAITPNTLDSAASTGSQHSSQLEPVKCLPHAPVPCGHQDSSFSKFEGSPLRARRSALLSPHGRTVFSLDIYSARNLVETSRSALDRN